MLPTAGLVVAALASFASPARAQFTAALVPPKPHLRADTLARQDSIRLAMRDMARRLTVMQQWVDSAAGALAIDTTDTAAPTPSPARPADAGAVRAAPEGDTIFHPGASAPATATELPLLALVGAGTLLLGVALLRR